jgi:hypothetical protein
MMGSIVRKILSHLEAKKKNIKLDIRAMVR